MNNQQKISDQTKESVQNTIKNLQQRSEHIEKLLEKGNDVIVFQIGSHTIKYGFASQETPQKIRNLIAYRINNGNNNVNENKNSSMCCGMHDSYKNYDNFDRESSKLETILRGQKKLGAFKTGKNMQSSSSQSKQKGRVDVGLKTLEFANKASRDDTNDVAKRQMIFGEEVFMVESNNEYIIRKPIKHGYLNTGEYNGDIRAAANDIENIIFHILTTRLGLSQKQFNAYKIIFCIPDIFHRQHVKYLVNMFLLNLQFSSVYMHQESILACFGYCIAQACVVDIGAEKINVCCVDEGLIIPNTLIRKNYGGDDIDLSLLRMLQKRNNIAFKQKANYKLEPNCYGDLHQIEKLKEKQATLEQCEDVTNRTYEMHCVRNGLEELFTIQHSDALYVAPALYFHADSLNALSKNTTNNLKNIDFEQYDYRSKKFDFNDDPEDNLEDVTGILFWKKCMDLLSLFESGIVWGQCRNMVNPNLAGAHILEQRRKDELKKEMAGQQSLIGQIVITPEQIEEQKRVEQLQQQETYKLKEEELLDPYYMSNLEDMISQSIANVKDSELRKKLANNILIIGKNHNKGGSSQTNKMVEELEDKLIERISQFDYNIERVEVIDTFAKKEMIPSQVSWIGATVIPRLDSIKDLWINQNRWLGLFEEGEDSSDDEISSTEMLRREERKDKSNEYGIKYLKEKVPFQW